MIKKVIIALLMGMLLCPVTMDAKLYKIKHTSGNPNEPHRNPTLCYVEVSVDSETGDFYICPNYDILGLNITIESNGVTYLDTTVSLNAGQSYTDTLASYAEGTYILTLSTSTGVIAQYEVSVEAD